MKEPPALDGRGVFSPRTCLQNAREFGVGREGVFVSPLLAPGGR